jgi:HEAT repeat associated with sister chromatid cohesion
MTNALPPSLHAALSEYRSAREIDGNITEVLRTVLAQIGNQSPATIANADCEIANAAGLSWWQSEQSTLQRIFRPKLSESQLLLKTPGLEYLYIFHRNGRLREQALNRVHGPLPSSFVAAAVAWRLNDWAPQVRDSAVNCARRCFDKTDPAVLARFFLSTLYQQASWGRWSEVERELISRQLRRSDVTSELAQLMLTERNGPLPSALAYVCRFPEIDCHLESLAKNAINPGIRAIALRALIDLEARYANGTQWRWIDKPMGQRRKEPRIECRQLTITANRKELYLLGLGDKSAIVRRIALSGIIKFDRHGLGYQKLAREYLSDPSPSVRARAEFIIGTDSAK